MNLSTAGNLLKPLEDELFQCRGKRVYFEPLHGNNGDKLIEMGSLEMLRKIGANLIGNPQQAQVIVINGGAGMTDVWLHGFKTIQKYNSHYPDKPLILFPSSFLFTKTDFPSLFQNRVAPTFLYAREAYSLKILQDLVFSNDVRLGIDHDMAFHLQNSSYIKELQSQKANKHILIVERNDAEGVTKAYQPQKSSLKERIPFSVRAKINRHIVWPIKRMSVSKSLGKLDIDTAFAKEAYKQILQDNPLLETLPVYAADISYEHLCSFEGFGQIIAEAAVVVTTRLHVGILAAMLDKTTYIKPSSYHKIRGIFEYSLADKQNIRLI